MISLKELNPHDYPTTPAIDESLTTLLLRLNKVRASYNTPMIVTSGLRSQLDQQRLIADGKSNAPKSHHLTGEAADIYDPDGRLKSWVSDNLSLVVEIGLWMESFESTPTWVHFQIVPPKSGNRIFKP